MTQPARIKALKALQLVVAVGVLALFWLIYPGMLFAIAGTVAVVYVLAALAAMRDRRIGIWLAFVLTVLAFGFSSWGVYRYLDNGFEYLAGHFPGRAGIHWPAYLFLFVALGALAAIVLSARSTHWMRRPQGDPRNDASARVDARGEFR